jgi:D-hexose-6-phosphate mutarotase
MSDTTPRIRTTLPPSVRVHEDGTLPRLSISSASGTSEVYFQGAHIAAWHPARARAPVLWASRRSLFEPGKPIRGGVPICFPWFGANDRAPSAPVHGFARTRPWDLVAANEEPSGTVTLEMELAGEAASPQWPHRFALRYRMAIGTELRLELDVLNTGAAPFTFEEALHTYLAVTDVRGVTLTGLEGTEYLDKVAGFEKRGQGAEPVRFTAETDRIYLDTRAACVLRDPKGRRELTISKAGSDATVVWNPWINKARAMPDFGHDEWTEMVCVETCNANAHARTLAPGQSHTMAALVEVRDS